MQAIRIDGKRNKCGIKTSEFEKIKNEIRSTPTNKYANRFSNNVS